MVMAKVIFGFLSIIFFIIYFIIFKFFYNILGFSSLVADVIGLFIILVVMTPLAIISANALIALIKRS